MLKCGIALLPRFLVSAVLIEARDSEPGPVATCLTGLRIETRGKRVLFGEHGRVALEVILADASSVHPQAEALVTDELHDADRFIDSRVLLLVAIKLVLVDEHASCPFLFSLLY